MEVKIGVQHATRDIVFDSEQSHDQIVASVREAVAEESGLLVFADSKGRTVLVPADRLAYVEVGEEAARKVGFGSH
ncbi:MAG: DUF3107 domain-containing protein [Nocardioidaceae bacterium]